MTTNIHDNHRDRVRKKFLTNGFDGWHEHEVLEMLLFYAVPRIDTNPLAHALLAEFGSLAKVLDADTSDLMRVPGIGDSTATYLSALGRLQKVYARSRWEEKPLLINVEKTGAYCRDLIGRESVEMFGILCLDTKKRLIKHQILTDGGVDHVAVDVRKIAQIAISTDARYLVLFHNHPSGDATPSYDDIKLTESVNNTLSPLNIEVIEHIVVGGTDYKSLASLGKL